MTIELPQVKLRYINQCVEQKLIALQHILTSENPADALTKTLPTNKFQTLLTQFGLQFPICKHSVRSRVIKP